MTIRLPARAAALSVLLMMNGCGSLNPFRTGAATPGLDAGEAALQSGSGTVALRISDGILRDSPNNVPARLVKADALTLLGQYDDAAIIYQTLLARDSGLVRASLGLGRIKLASDPQAAEAEFRKVLDKDPKNLTALNNVGIACDLQGRHADAQVAYRTALAIAPDPGSTQVNLALSLAMSGHGPEAVSLMRGKANEPGASAKIRHDFAVVLALAGQRDEAERILSESMTREEARQALASVTGAGSTPPREMAPDRRDIGRVAESDMSQDLPRDRQSVRRGGDAWPPDVVEAVPPRQAVAPMAPSGPMPGVIRPSTAEDSGMPPQAAAAPALSDAPAGPSPRPASPDMPAAGGTPTITSAPPPPPAIAPVSGYSPSGDTAAALVRTAPLSPVAPRQVEAPAAFSPPPAVASLSSAPSIAPPSPPAPPPGLANAHGTELSPGIPRGLAARGAIPPPAAAAPVPMPVQKTAIREAPAQTEAPRHEGGASQVQFTAAPTQEAAQATWVDLSHRYPEILGRKDPIVIRVERDGKVFWRLRTDGFDSADEARSVCARVKASGHDCFVPRS